MTVAVITDSTADLPPEIADQFGITVVPLYVQFGKESYRDSIDMMGEEFYSKMMNEVDYPKTSTPNLGDFLGAFDSTAARTKEILGVLIDAKMSGTFNVAAAAAKEADESYNIELIDTQTAMMAEGMLALEAVKMARSGGGLTEIADAIRTMKSKACTVCLVDNALYLSRGGHASKGFKEHFASTTEGVPLVELRDGIKPFGKEADRASAIEALFTHVRKYAPPKALAVEYAVDREEAEAVANRMREEYPDVPVYISVIGAVVGAHLGPGTLAMAVLQQ
jgi:DegV family protein with EDD domain